MITVDTFAPYTVNRNASSAEATDWIVPMEFDHRSDSVFSSVVALRRAVQPEGGIDGGTLNRLLVQATTGLSPEQHC